MSELPERDLETEDTSTSGVEVVGELSEATRTEPAPGAPDTGVGVAPDAEAATEIADSDGLETPNEPVAAPVAPRASGGNWFTNEEFDVLLEESDVETAQVVDEIARLTEAFEAMRDTALDQIRATARGGQERNAELEGALRQVLSEFRGMREEMLETSRVARNSVDAAQRARDGVNDLHERFSLARAVRMESGRTPVRGSSIGSTLLVGAAAMALSWSAVIWFKTGDATLALAGVVAGNFAACGLLLRDR